MAQTRARQTFSRAAHFPAPAGGARGLSRAANGWLFYRAGIFARLLEMLLADPTKLLQNSSMMYLFKR
jgi:hypothetical protein